MYWDMSDSLKMYWDSVNIANYPNAEIITTNGTYSSTATFNCHGYAWHRSEGGEDRWIGLGGQYDNDPEYGYWNDENVGYSYVEVTGSIPFPGKVNWSQGDHSAITTATQGWLISKWGTTSLMKHAWDDSPYGTSGLKYYRLNFTITGPNKVCSSNSTFTFDDYPANAVISWTVTPNSLITPSSGQGSSATFHLNNCSNFGNGRITFSYPSLCGGTEIIKISKNFVAGGPDPTDVSLRVQDNLTGQTVDPMQMCPNTTYVLYCDNSSSCGTSNYSWTLPYGMSLISQSQNWALINTNSSSGGIMMVHGSTCCSGCGSNVLILTDVLSTGGWNCGGGWYMSFTPNPTSGETVMELKTDKGKSYEGNDPWELVIYDRQLAEMKSAENVKGSKYTIGTAGWREGMYIVKVKMKDRELYGKFIVNH
jgi:hypothetical protein